MKNNVEQPIYLEIKKVVEEAKDLKTLIFEHHLNAKPGQFVNVWIPGVDEKPYSISFQDKKRFGITIFSIGKFSKKLHGLKEGDKVGIRGPYGKGFRFRGRKAVLAGGGCGSAPLTFLADELVRRGNDVKFIAGARSKAYVGFRKRYSRSKLDFMICTDDGSLGEKGFTTDILEKTLKKGKVDMVYSCGPETMMKKAIELCDKYNVGCQVSLERYMKCGFGVCGQCCVDPLGICICKDGPVLDKEIAKKIVEFGRYKRDGTGRKVDL